MFVFINYVLCKIIFSYLELNRHDFLNIFIFFGAWQLVGGISLPKNSVLLPELEQEQETGNITFLLLLLGSLFCAILAKLYSYFVV